jgi:hypothetical protein
MKSFLIFLSFIIVLLTFGCKKAKEATIETKTVTKEYVKGVAEVPSKTRVITELASLRQAIKMYKVENEKFPESLSDLSVKVKDINEYEYDPNTGKVTSKYYLKY